ncbi:MAG TPA: iron dependent repressor, metal binding and dimerization domain protein [Patescibacteria group bacterium]|jgi:DtxR family Mn-dependent transcriptional regulator|nr:iron dependent repressor, metal binding and dimerization domain protein [Patescibacteria group bacterium]
MLNSLISLLVLLIIAVTVWLFFRPERGFFWRWQHARSITRQVQREDALKHIHRCQRHGRSPTLESLAGATQVSINEAIELLSELEQHDLVQLEGESFELTPRGRDYALHIIRAHRLWERYLADETGYAREEWHDRAERAEHSLTPADVEDLASELGNPTHDPHGDPIPTAEGSLVPHGGQPLIDMPLDVPVRIVHLEDEPEVVYAQLVAEGLGPGMEVRLLELSPRRVRFWADGDEHILAPIVAANISVLPVPAIIHKEDEIGEKMSSLGLGEWAEVIGISRVSRGNERRRFLDLGILPGTIITAEISSPGGDPTAYRIRDALIALRREQADLITVRRLHDPVD